MATTLSEVVFDTNFNHRDIANYILAAKKDDNNNVRSANNAMSVKSTIIQQFLHASRPVFQNHFYIVFGKTSKFDTDIFNDLEVNNKDVMDGNSFDFEFKKRMFFSCQNVSIPGKIILGESYEWNSGFKIEMPTSAQYGDGTVNLKMRLGNDYFERNFFEKWIDSIHNKETGYLKLYKTYCLNFYIYQLNTIGNAVYVNELINVYPKSIGSIEFNQDSQDQYQTFDVQLQYEGWNSKFIPDASTKKDDSVFKEDEVLVSEEISENPLGLDFLNELSARDSRLEEMQEKNFLQLLNNAYKKDVYDFLETIDAAVIGEDISETQYNTLLTNYVSRIDSDTSEGMEALAFLNVIDFVDGESDETIRNKVSEEFKKSVKSNISEGGNFDPTKYAYSNLDDIVKDNPDNKQIIFEAIVETSLNEVNSLNDLMIKSEMALSIASADLGFNPEESKKILNDASTDIVIEKLIETTPEEYNNLFDETKTMVSEVVIQYTNDMDEKIEEGSLSSEEILEYSKNLKEFGGYDEKVEGVDKAYVDKRSKEIQEAGGPKTVEEYKTLIQHNINNGQSVNEYIGELLTIDDPDSSATIQKIVIDDLKEGNVKSLNALIKLSDPQNNQETFGLRDTLSSIINNSIFYRIDEDGNATNDIKEEYVSHVKKAIKGLLVIARDPEEFYEIMDSNTGRSVYTQSEYIQFLLEHGITLQ